MGERLTGPQRGFALAWLGLAVACSLLAAYLLYLLVELPSVRLSHRLKFPRG